MKVEIEFSPDERWWDFPYTVILYGVPGLPSYGRVVGVPATRRGARRIARKRLRNEGVPKRPASVVEVITP